MKDYPWLTSYPEGLDWREAFPLRPLYSLVDDAARDFPGHTALDFLGTKYTYRRLNELIDRAAGGFRKLGIKKGVHAGIYLPNCPQFVIAYFGILKAGGTVVNFSPLYSQRELEHQVIDSDIELLVTANLAMLYPKAKELLGKGRLRTLVIADFASALPPVKRALFSLFKRNTLAAVAWDEATVPFAQVLSHEPLDAPAAVTPAEDVAVLQYTGGTTGVPKGAMLTHENLYVNALQCARWCQLDPPGTGITLAALPFFHVFAMTVCMNASIKMGNAIVLLPRFDLKQALKTIHAKRPTVLPGVPTMYNAIANCAEVGKYDLTSVKVCISGGAPLPMEVKERFEKITGCHLIEGYGLTEAGPVTNANPLLGENRAGSIGLPLPGTIIEIEDMERPGKMLGIGETGEICVRGPQVMLGYYKRTEATAEVIVEGKPYRRLRTGDIGRLDKDGYAYVVDRRKEMILTNGFNVYPRVVEEAIYEHEAVLEAAVIGVPDVSCGEKVKAFVALKPGKTVEQEALLSFLKERIGKHEMPKLVEFVDALPKTMIGKIDKKPLKERG